MERGEREGDESGERGASGGELGAGGRGLGRRFTLHTAIRRSTRTKEDLFAVDSSGIGS